MCKMIDMETLAKYEEVDGEQVAYSIDMSTMLLLTSKHNDKKNTLLVGCEDGVIRAFDPMTGSVVAIFFILLLLPLLLLLLLLLLPLLPQSMSIEHGPIIEHGLSNIHIRHSKSINVKL